MIITPGTGTLEHIQFLRDGDETVGFTAPRPSNVHAHLRSGPLMRAIAKPLMQHVHYLLLMPNTGPILSPYDVVRYYRAAKALADEVGCGHIKLIMTVFYSASLTPDVIDRLVRLREVLGVPIEVKWYPPEQGATTGSGHGIPLDWKRPEFKAMEENNIPLLVHPESVFDEHGDRLSPFDGEAYFIQNVLWPFRDKRHGLRMSVEHANTAQAIEFVRADTNGNTFVTITPHGVLCTMHDLEGPFGALLKCKTRLQTPENRAAVEDFMVSGDRRAGAGDDTAAHLGRTKLVPFDKAADGVFWGTHTWAAYAAAFNRKGALDDRYAQFTAFNALDWRGLPRPEASDIIRFRRELEKDIPDPIIVPEENDVVFHAGWADTSQRRMHLGLVCEAV